jgi:hypothetical protein
MTYIDRRIVRLIPVGTTTFSSTVGGLVPASGFDDDKFLCSDRTWKYVTSTSISDFNTAVQALIDASGGGAGVTDGDKGDIIVSGSGSVWTVDSLPISRITDLQTSLDAKVDDSQISAFGATLVDDADAAAARATLELGTLATQSGTFSGTSSGTNTGDQTITLTSDVTGSGTGSFATTIAAGAVSLSKMANMATASFLGRNTAGTGSPEVLSASTARTMLSINNVENTALSTWSGSTNITTLGTVATGSWNATNIPLGRGGTGASLASPTDDKLMFWDSSASAVAWLTLGTNLSITGTTINASGGSGGLSDGDYGDIVVSGTGTVLTIDSAASIQVAGIGVGSATSGSNVLQTNGDILFDANGSGDCNISYNKDTAGDDAQFFFNTNYSTRAIVGTQGDDDLTIKTSPDGSSFFTALVADKDNGRVTLPAGITDQTYVFTNGGANECAIPAVNWMMLTADYTLTSDTTEQKLFNTTTNGTLTLPTGIYHYETFIYLTTMSATSGNMAFDPIGGGTAVADRFGHHFWGIDNNSPLNAGTCTGSASVTQQSPNSAVSAGTGTGMVLHGSGMFRISTGGTIIPSGTLVTANAAIVKAGSWFKITRLGDTGDTYVGAWT